MLTDTLVQKVLTDPSVRYWVKDTYKELLDRDPVDALDDVMLIASMLQEDLDLIKREVTR